MPGRLMAIAALSASFAAVLVAQTRAPAGPRRLDAAGPIGYFIADGTGHAGFRAGDRQLAEWAVEAWQRSAAGRVHFEPSAESTAIVRVYWAEPNEGQYG